MKIKLPLIRRARGYRLYTECNERLVDLCLANGSALMGHKPASVIRELKNTAEQGLFAPYPSVEEARFLKALEIIFPACHFHIFSDHTELRIRLAEVGIAKLSDPGMGDDKGAGALWRPCCPEPASPVLVPVLPWALAPAVLVLKASAPSLDLGPSHSTAPILLAASTRALYDFIRNKEKRNIFFPKVQKALETSLWKVRGIYLHAEVDAADYEAIWQEFLVSGFLLPQDHSVPAVLPGELSPGEESKLAKLLG